MLEEALNRVEVGPGNIYHGIDPFASLIAENCTGSAIHFFGGMAAKNLKAA